MITTRDAAPHYPLDAAGELNVWPTPRNNWQALVLAIRHIFTGGHAPGITRATRARLAEEETIVRRLAAESDISQLQTYLVRQQRSKNCIVVICPRDLSDRTMSPLVVIMFSKETLELLGLEFPPEHLETCWPTLKILARAAIPVTFINTATPALDELADTDTDTEAAGAGTGIAALAQRRPLPVTTEPPATGGAGGKLPTERETEGTPFASSVSPLFKHAAGSEARKPGGFGPTQARSSRVLIKK